MKALTMNAEIRLIQCSMVALCFLGACSQGAAPMQATASTASTLAAQPPDDESNGATSNPCDVITVTDVASIFSAPVHRRLDDFGKDKCIFNSDGGANLTISTSKDDDRKTAWDIYRRTMVPYAGLGDGALQYRDGATVIAGKGDIDCMAELQGIGDSSAEATIAKDRGEALARKLGALCAKIFTAR